MFARLQDQIAACHEEARLARAMASLHRSPRLREEYRRLQEQWLQVGRALEFATEVSGFLEWRSRRLEPPPP